MLIARLTSFTFAVATVLHLIATSGDAAELPPDSAYAIADENGHLIIDAERARFWAVIGGFPKAARFAEGDTGEMRKLKALRAHKEVVALVDRFVDLGFNMNRMWRMPGDEEYEKGDGSAAEIKDYYVYIMKKRGLKLWAAGINDHGHATPEDVGIVDDPATADEWAAAVAQFKGGKVHLKREGKVLAKWDERCEALTIERRNHKATHYNKWTGLRACDDPVFVAWELSNEEWCFGKLVSGVWRKFPKYFQKTLFAKFNAFLKRKYGTTEKLGAAWKTMLPGESLEKGTVQLLPLKSDKDPVLFGVDTQGMKQLKAAQVDGKTTYGRADFSRERGEDVMAFFVEIHVASKLREAKAFKPLGKSTRSCPLALDTGIGYEIQSQWLHQNADVSVHDAYVNGWGWNPKRPETFRTKQSERLYAVGAEAVAANRGPWNCWLLKPPGICQGVPWLEHNKVEGKPYFAYETQIQQPAKYRADFPLRLGWLASIQDWDAMCWHYFAPPWGLSFKEKPFGQTMDVTVGGHPQGYHYTFDEVQGAMMRAGAFIIRNSLLAPAAKPTKFIYGRKALHDPDSMDYGHSYGRLGMDMLYTTYQYGVRIEIDPAREDDAVIGPRVSFDHRHRHNPYTPTRETVYDWKKGYLAFDAPGAAAFTGFLPELGGSYRFAASGATISDIDIGNPQPMYDPVTNEEGYIAFALYSEDGKPLRECANAAMSLVSTSFNRGFSLSKRDFERAGCPDHPLAAKAGKKRAWGRDGVDVARVAGTIRCAAIDGMRYTMLDWHMKPLRVGWVYGGRLRIPNDLPVFVVRLAR